ncbi:MAG: hypothetical protein Q7S74_05325 [Nanoarchaeota archaeon]|nr:hypothetical protein [Nanoarchaeota archaeon]
MTLKRAPNLDKIWARIINYKMKKKDKKLFIESIILIIIYFLSFAVLSLGWVQKTFFGMSALTFIFAVILTLILYWAYKKAIK